MSGSSTTPAINPNIKWEGRESVTDPEWLKSIDKFFTPGGSCETKFKGIIKRAKIKCVYVPCLDKLVIANATLQSP